MSYHAFCMGFKDRVLESMVNQRIISVDIANAVSDIFAQSKEDFDCQIFNKYGNQVNQDMLLNILQKVFRDIASKLISQGPHRGYGSFNEAVTYNPGAFQAASGMTSYGSPLSMTPISQVIAGAGSIGYQAVSSATQQEPVKPANSFGSTKSEPIDNNQKDGKTFISIHSRGDQGLTMNQKIAAAPAGTTKDSMDNQYITLLRKVVEVTESSGENTLIKFDHLTFNNNKGEVCFDDSREVIAFLDQILSLDDILTPYFRVVDYTKLCPIHINHDEFFDNFNSLGYEVSDACRRAPSDAMEGAEYFKIIRDRLSKKSVTFCREVEEFLLKMAQHIFMKHFRFSSVLDKKLKLNSIGALDSLMSSNEKNIKELRDIEGFGKVMHDVLNTIYEFVTFSGKIAPMYIDLNYADKYHPSLDPYLQTRRFMGIDNTECVNTMEYWKYADNPTIQNKILEMIKRKVLVRFPTSMIVTNLYSPVLMRSSLFSGTPAPVLVKSSIDLKAIKQEFIPGGEIIALLNHTKIKDAFPKKLFVKVGDDFRKFNLSGTLEGDLILEV